MKVITLLDTDFSVSCDALSHKIMSGYNPDIIIGVLTGGGYVGQNVYKAIKNKRQCLYTEIKIQRDGTKKKEKGWRNFILQNSPRFLLNWMRMAESFVLEYKAKKNNPKRNGKIVLNTKINSLLLQGNKNILLVDDAIDSGATLLLIKDYLMKNYDNIIVKIAVITVTTPKPLINADFCLYNNRILVRFPWSNDVKRKK